MDKRKNKKIYDPIHGFVVITPLMQDFIDTNEFQRLREMKQLGLTSFVFPSATHTRFEHSIGVSHIAGELMTFLRINQPELNISDRDIEICRVAGLLHDIGHGPFSHLYDDYMLSGVTSKHHEERGLDIILKMVEDYNIKVTHGEIHDIMEMIDPSDDHKMYWRYQIVSNKIHSIDVDKMDYIKRDCYHIGLTFGGEYERLLRECRVVDYYDNKLKRESLVETYKVLAWNVKAEFDIFSLFSARYRLHKQVLTHHTVKAYEYKILKLMYDLQMTECIVDRHPLHLYTDTEVLSYMYRKERYNSKQSVTYTRRKKMVKELYTEYPINATNEELKEFRVIRKDYVLDCIPIGFSNSKTHPMYEIFYYKPLDPNFGFKKSKKVYQHFAIPHKHREILWRLYISDDKKYLNEVDSDDGNNTDRENDIDDKEFSGNHTMEFIRLVTIANKQWDTQIKRFRERYNIR